jgi:monofunctional biosynthetic peptidoglycan transglycosylase
VFARDHAQEIIAARISLRQEQGARRGPSGRANFFVRSLFAIAISGAIASIFLVAAFTWIPVPATPLAGIRAVQSAISGQPIKFQKSWVAIDEMSPVILKAAIASEDFRFVEHNGFDFQAIKKAIEANKRAERRGHGRIRGGSTISQQTAKNVFLWPGRNYLRKGLEAWLTVWIETFWSKRRILEVYLNVIEFGDGVYGVEAASRKYFKKSAKRLSASEAALLIAVLPNPKRFKVDRPSGYVRYRQTAILRRLSYVEVPTR